MEDTTKEYLESLIVAYLDGSADSHQIIELKGRITSSEEDKQLFDDLCEIWTSSQAVTNVHTFDVEKAYARFHERTRLEKSITRTGIRPIWRIAGIAASLALVVVLSFLGGQANMKKSFADIVVEAPLGSRTRVSLPDGSEVWINAGTRLSYSQGFGVENRDVLLSGEGYFEVTKNEKLPFVVTSGDIRVSVLGTQFNFRDYPQDREVTVALYEGKVVLENLLKKQNKQIMKPLDYMVLDKSDGIATVHSSSANRENCEKWKKGYVTFDEMLFSDIVNMLELNYDIHICVNRSSLLNERYRGIFIRQEQTIDEVLGALSAASNGKMRYTKSGNEINIY